MIVSSSGIEYQTNKAFDLSKENEAPAFDNSSINIPGAFSKLSINLAGPVADPLLIIIDTSILFSSVISEGSSWITETSPIYKNGSRISPTRFNEMNNDLNIAAVLLICNQKYPKFNVLKMCLFIIFYRSLLIRNKKCDQLIAFFKLNKA